MLLNALRRGAHVKIGAARFLILKKLDVSIWQLENTATGEWCRFTEEDLLDRFARHELTFDCNVADGRADSGTSKLDRSLSAYPQELVAVVQSRVQYLKEIDRQQPIVITSKSMEPLIRSISKRISDTKPPSWRTLARDYRKWLSAGRDVRAVILRYSDRGSRVPRLLPEVKSVIAEVIDELYMTAERKRVPEVHLEIARRLADANQFRPAHAPLPIPSQRAIYREIERISPYERMVARYGKRRAEMEFRVSGIGPETSRALQRVSMDHTASDIIVVDDNTMLPLGRPTITSALDEHTRCPMGFYTGFEPPSCLSVMRCLKHAILPKSYVPREFPAVKNSWECYGVPELVVVDNPPEFHSSHFERACLQIGADIQYAKVLVPWYKGKLERFQGTMNHDLMHGNPGTTFSNILERDEYDPTRHAVVMLSTFREMLHKWIIDVYLQTPHRGIKDTPIHRWHSDVSALPPPLPPNARDLDVVLGMTAQRVVFHYGIELEGLKYNGPELGELRRRIGSGAKVELTFDPGDLAHINVLDSQKGACILVPAIDQAYTHGLSLWQHRVIRRYAQRQLNARTDIVALAQAKAQIRALVERDFNRKSTRGRKRHARFLEDHTGNAVPAITIQPPFGENPTHCEVTSVCAIRIAEAEASPEVRPVPSPSDVFSDDEVLPVFEANLELPRVPVDLGELPARHQAE
ncbi:MAG TPA: Mu transposase C-terminal domain-containing protein [Candidatus Dormibacteraeota bacterium]|nr:Mu transposase C-terminal domain-containing protein [Candidatus Dormibacteraeota bacterium]